MRACSCLILLAIFVLVRAEVYRDEAENSLSESSDDGFPAVNVVDTSANCLETNVLTNGGCVEVQAAFDWTKRGTIDDARTLGDNFYIGLMQNYLKPGYSNFSLNKSMVFIATDSSKNVEVIVKSHNERLTIPITKQSFIFAYNFLTFRNKSVLNTTDRFKALQFQTKSGTQMSLFVINEEYASVDGYTALPYNTIPGVLTYYYYALSVPKSSHIANIPTGNSAFLIVGWINHTTVIITPTQTVVDPHNPTQMVNSGESTKVVLNEMETLYVASPDDLTGSRVITDKPISFITGHECGNLPNGRVGCNHMVEQIPPTATWGNQFFISSISQVTTGDIFKIVASSNNTAVNILCTNSKREQASDIDILVPRAGTSVNFTVELKQSCIVTSKNPILLVQFAPLKSATIMVTVPATHQYLNTHLFTTVYAGDIKYNHYMRVFVGSNNFNPSSISLDGEKIAASWMDILCKDGAACGHVGLVSLTDGAHVVGHDNSAASIGIMVYGISSHESYGYVGGLMLTPLKSSDLNVAIVRPKMTSFVINAGKYICLECNTKPSTPEAHQFISWSIDTVDPGVKVNRLPNGTLCINKVTAGHTGTYQCKVGANSLKYTLSVIVGIIVMDPPPPPSADVASIGIGMDKITYVDTTEKNIIHIYCPLEGLDDIPRWFANGSQIHPGIRYTVTKDYLMTQKPLTYGCTEYSCRVTFASYTYEESSTVCVRDFYAPKNLTITGPSKVVEGKRFFLHCNATGFPEPKIIWTAKSNPLPEEGITNYNNGTIRLRLLEGNQTTYCCIAVSSKKPSAHKCINITLILLPHIKKPVSIMRRPGDCKDVTDYAVVSEHVGINLCYHISSSLYLHCVVDRGNPKPNITWFKDGSTLPTSVKLMYNGTALLFQNTTTDVNATVHGLPTVGGNYTCVTSNRFGTAAASSVIVPLGDIPRQVLQSLLIPVQKALYHRIHTALSRIVSHGSIHRHVVLLKTAKPLLFDDFNPGKLFDGSENSILPRTMENMFNMVDILPMSLPLLQGTRPLYKTYQNLLNKMMPVKNRVSARDVQDATNYLRELVVDPAGLEKANRIPRLNLYLQYKNRYNSKNLEVRREMDLQHRKLGNEDYSDWYASAGVLLESERDSIYMQWVALGDKQGVEKKLELLDLQDHTKPLNDIKAIIQASKNSSEMQDDQTYLPVQFLPDNWYQLYLPKSVDETADQIRYYHATLKSKMFVLEQAKTYLKSLIDQRTYKLAPDRLLDSADRVLSNEVIESEKKRYECILTRGPLECQQYSTEVNSVLHLMDQYANAFWATEQYKHATSIDNMWDAIQDSIQALKKKMVNLEMIANIKTTLAATKQLDDRDTVNAENEHNSLIFNFNSTTEVNNKSNFSFPVVDRLLWYISSGSANEYNMTVNYLNSASVKINAKLVKVNIHRRWMKLDIFADQALQLENSTLISPGPLNLKSFAKKLRENKYQLPMYPSAFILATDIQISVKVPVPFHLMPSLLKMSYDSTFRGGFGPFVIGNKVFPGGMSNVIFLVEQRDTDILLTLPGAQLIGYICSVVPKSPLGNADEDHTARHSLHVRKGQTTLQDQGSTVSNKMPDKDTKVVSSN